MNVLVGYRKKVGRFSGLVNMTSVVMDGGVPWYATAAVGRLASILSCPDGGVKPRVPHSQANIDPDERGAPRVVSTRSLLRRRSAPGTVPPLVHEADYDRRGRNVNAAIQRCDRCWRECQNPL
jgi:hypothetical protein